MNSGDVSTQIEKSVHFHSAFGAFVCRPGEQVNAQVYNGGVQCLGCGIQIDR